MADAMTTEVKGDDAMKFTQEDGLKKTYAHYLLFKEDSPTLAIVIDKLTKDVKFKKFFHTSDKSLFKTLLGIRNREHIRAALDVFGVGFKEPSRSFGSLDIKKYVEMSAYAKLNLDFITKYETEMRENAHMVNLIHELVINYYPADGSLAVVDETNKNILNAARDDLQKSLKDGYYKGSGLINTEFKEETKPADINALKTLPIFTDDRKREDLIKKAEKHYEQYSNLDRNLSAVASLYADAHRVNVGQALQVVATAHASRNIIDSTMSYSDLLRMFNNAYTNNKLDTMKTIFDAIKTKFKTVKPDNDTLYGISKVFRSCGDDTIIDVNFNVKVEDNSIFKIDGDSFMVPPLNSKNSCWLNCVLMSVIVPIFIQCNYKFAALIKKINMGVPIFSFLIHQYMNIIFNEKSRKDNNVVTTIKKCMIRKCKTGDNVNVIVKDINDYYTLNEVLSNISFPYSSLFNKNIKIKILPPNRDKSARDSNFILVSNNDDPISINGVIISIGGKQNETFTINKDSNIINFILTDTKPTIVNVFFNAGDIIIDETKFTLQSIIFGSGGHFITQVRANSEGGGFNINDLNDNITKTDFRKCPSSFVFCGFVYIKERIEDNEGSNNKPKEAEQSEVDAHIKEIECREFYEKDDSTGGKAFRRQKYKTKKRGGRLHMKTHRRK